MRCDGEVVLWDFRVRGLSFGTVVFICSVVGGWVGQTVDAPVGPGSSEHRSAPSPGGSVSCLHFQMWAKTPQDTEVGHVPHCWPAASHTRLDHRKDVCPNPG